MVDMRNPAFAKATTDKVKNEILGKPYELSFAFISKNKIKELNKNYRKINEPTDVLSFQLEKNSGEILICKAIAKIKAPKFDMTFEDYLLFLVIHALLHLKGLDHSDKMKRYEQRYHSRYRRRNLRS
ncbi:MAG: rRNA maturation RNase YbeY [Patescibacteria group bacterium]